MFDLPALQTEHAQSLRDRGIAGPRRPTGRRNRCCARPSAACRMTSNVTTTWRPFRADLDRKDEALVMLEKAGELGFRDPKLIRADEDLKSLATIRDSRTSSNRQANRSMRDRTSGVTRSDRRRDRMARCWSAKTTRRGTRNWGSS